MKQFLCRLFNSPQYRWSRQHPDKDANSKMEDIRRGRQVVGPVRNFMRPAGTIRMTGTARSWDTYRWARRNKAKLVRSVSRRDM